MPKFLFGFQARLIASFILVLLLAVGSLAFFPSVIALQEAEKYQEELAAAKATRLSEIVESRFNTEGWSGVQNTLPSTSSALGVRLVVTDPLRNEILAYSDRELELMDDDNIPPEGMIIPIYDQGKEIGRLQLKPMEPGDMPADPSPLRLVEEFRRSLIWTGLGTGLIGVGLIFLTTRRVLIPLRVLTSAARKLGRGDLSGRVAHTGKDEIGELANAFNAMTSGLEKVEKQRRQLFSDVAHELRTPLANATGYLEAVKDGLLEPTPETIDIIRRQIDHLTKLVDDLRLLTLAESNSLPLQQQADSVMDVLQHSIQTFNPKAVAKGISLSFHHPDALPLASIDRVRIAQLVGNLLENAILHTPSGGAIVVSSSATDSMVVVRVADNGEGIPETDLPYVFERFYRSDRSRNRASGGSGLGLAIARQLVQAHHGEIQVESQAGVGSVFSFFVPLKPHLKGRALLQWQEGSLQSLRLVSAGV